MDAEYGMSQGYMEKGLPLLEQRGLITKVGERYMPSLVFYALTTTFFKKEMEDQAGRSLYEIGTDVLTQIILSTGEASLDEIHCMANCLVALVRQAGR